MYLSTSTETRLAAVDCKYYSKNYFNSKNDKWLSIHIKRLFQ